MRGLAVFLVITGLSAVPAASGALAQDFGVNSCQQPRSGLTNLGVTACQATHETRTAPASIWDDDSGDTFITVYGGAALPGDAVFTGPEPLNGGVTGGAAIDLPFGPAGVTFGVDAFAANRQFTNFEGDSIATASVMATAKYTAKLTGDFDVVGGLGLGGMFVSEQYDMGGTGTGLGYEVSAGIERQITPSIAVGLMGLYQNTFTPIRASNGFDVQVPHSAILASLRFALPMPAPAPR